MPPLPFCANGMSGKRPLASLAQYGLGMHIKEPSSVLRANRRLSNRVRVPK
jgi:hypothetical protein